MSAIDKTYRFRVYEKGSVSVVEFTFTTEIMEPPGVPGQTARPMDGTVETVPWSVQLVDHSGRVVRSFGDANNRLSWQLRLADISVSEDGGTWVVLGTGRISGIVEPEGRGSFLVTVDDERTKERKTDVFNVTDTVIFAPTGLKYPYGDVPEVPNTHAYVGAVVTYEGNDYVWLKVIVRINSTAVLRHIIDDVKPEALPGGAGGANHDVGNFETMRIYADGAEREIVTFDTFYESEGTDWYKLNPARSHVESIKRMQQDESIVRLIDVWVPVGDSDSGDNTWPTTPASLADKFTDVQLYPVGTRPTEQVPLHIGVADAAHDYGTADGKIHPFDLAERLYDNTGIRSNSTAMTALKNDPRYPLQDWRISSVPPNMAQWLQDNIYKPNLVLPFINSAGEITPKSIAPPDADTFDADALFIFNEHNMVGGAPTWDTPAGQLRNVVIGTYSLEDRPSGGLLSWLTGLVGALPDQPVDQVTATDVEMEKEYDNVDDLGRVEQKVSFRGLHTRAVMDSLLERYANELFSMYGDAPVFGNIRALRATQDVEAGDWVKVECGNYPNLVEDSGRGGTRIVLVLSKSWTPAGPDFTIVDGGPLLAPLSTPTISSVVNHADYPKHIQDVTYSGLSGSENADLGYLEYAQSVGEPAASSSLWKLALVINASAAGTATVGGLPSSTSVWWRLRAAKQGRIRSSWSIAVNQTTTSISPPTGLAFSGITGRTATMSWDIGDVSYQIELLVDSVRSDILPPGTNTTEVRGLEPSTVYTGQVRHIDPYGGVSTTLGLANNMITVADAEQWPAPVQLLVLDPKDVGVPT